MLDKRNQEIRELRTDLDNAHKKNLDHRRAIVEMESQAQELRSSQLSARLKEQSLSQEIEMLKKSNEWLDNELKTKTTEFKKFRTERISRFNAVQSDLDRLQAEHSALVKSNEDLKDRFGEVSRKYDQSLAKVRDLQNAHDGAEESFRKEMAAQQRLAELWERSAKDAKKRVEDLENVLSTERSKKSGDVAKWKAEAERERARADKLQKQLSAIDSELQNSYKGNGPDRSLTAFTTPQRGGSVSTPSSAVFSPSARIISDLQKQGTNLVDLYSEFHDTKVRLERERHKNEALRAEMDAILDEMENHAPTILADREEKKRLELELADMSVELEQTQKRLDETTAKVKAADMKSKDDAQEISLLSTQIRDLSRQLQYLLIQNQMLIDNEPALNATEHAAMQKLLDGGSVEEEAGPESDTQRLITQRLVLFKDIIELQKQNENLLKVTRELGTRMEREEREMKRKVENFESSAVEEAKSAISHLQDELKRMEVASEALKRERDMFRRMLSEGRTGDDQEKSAPVLESGYVGSRDFRNEDLTNYSPLQEQLAKQNEEMAAMLKEVQTSYDAFKTESVTTITSLNKQVTELSDIRGTLQVKLSRAQSQEEYMQERYKNLQQDLAVARSETEQLRKRSDEMQGVISRHEARAERLSEEIIDANSQAETLRAEVSNLKAEKQLWRAVEERLTKENKDLLEEKGRLNGVISNYQLMEAERDSHKDGTVRRLQSQIESLDSQLSASASKLAAAEEDLKRVNARKEADMSEFVEKIDRLQKEVSSARDLYNDARTRAEALDAKTREQQVMISSLEEKLKIYHSTPGEQSRERAVEEELASVRGELELTKNELSLTRKHRDELADIAKTAEEALEKMTTTHDEYEASIQQKLTEKDSELEQLKTQLNETKELLDAANSEMSNNKVEESNVVKQLREENSKLESSLKALQDNEAHLMRVQQQLKDELNNSGKLSREAQENYDKELVKHAEAAKTAQALREEVAQLKETISKLSKDEERAREQLSSSQASWDGQKYTYEYEIEQLKSRLEDVSTQNRVLLDQVESLSKRRISGSGGADNAGTSNDQDEGDAPIDQSREILAFVRREKEIAECNLDVAQQEIRRLQQRLEHVTSELDQARLDSAKDSAREEELARIAADHQRVLQQLENVNVLRESNASLRSQSQHYQKKARELEEESEKLREKLEPLEEQLRSAVAEANAKDGEIKLLKEDNERWRARSSEIMQKYQRIDPAELKRIQEEAETLKQQASALQVEIDNLKKENASLVTERDEAAKKLADESKKVAESSAEKAKLEEEATKLKRDISNYDTKMANFRDRANVKVKELVEKVRDLTTKLQAAEDAQNNAASQATETGEADQRLKALEEESSTKTQRITTLEQDNAAKTERIGTLEGQLAEKSQRVDTLEDEVNKLSDEILELKSKLAAASAGDASAAAAVTDAAFAEGKQKLEAKITELTNEISSLKQASSDAAASSGDTIPLDEHNKKLDELQQKLNEAAANVGAAPDLEKLKTEARTAAEAELRETIEKELRPKIEMENYQRTIALKKKYDDQLAAARANAATSGNSEAAKAQIDALKAQHQQELDKLKASFEEEKKKAVAGVRKEVEMKQKLLRQKIARLEEEKKAGGGAPAAAGGANAPALSIKGAAPGSRIPRPTVLKPGAESGKRHLSDASGDQSAQKKRKEDN